MALIVFDRRNVVFQKQIVERLGNQVVEKHFLPLGVPSAAQLHEPQALRLQLEVSDRDDHEVAQLAIKAFELSQSLKERWLTADYQSKRTILSIMLESARLNSENVEFSARKPFNLLQDQNLVPLIGATGSAFHAHTPRFPANNQGRLQSIG
jgi:hypothetical protein